MAADEFIEVHLAFEARGDAAAWLELSNGAMSWKPNSNWKVPGQSWLPMEAQQAPSIFLADAMNVVGGELETLRWCLPRELTTPEQSRFHPSRVVPFTAVLTCACPTCGAAALIVGREDAGGFDAYRVTRASALCSREPHVAPLASSRFDSCYSARS